MLLLALLFAMTIETEVALTRVLHERAFEIDTSTPPMGDLSKQIAVTLTATPEKVSAGAPIEVQLTFENTSDQPVRLDFTAHSGPMLTLTIADAKTESVVHPPPMVPPLPPPGPPYRVAVVLDPGAKAVHTDSWTPEGVAAGTYTARIQAMFHYAGANLTEPTATVVVE